jgi:hypothetical protein
VADEPGSVDEVVAEDALAALAGRECEYGGGPIDPRTGACEDQGHTHCRWFCGESWCDHVLLSWNDDGDYEGPDIPLPPQWLGPVGDWPDAWKQAAFDDLPDLADYYAEIEDGRLPNSFAYDIAAVLCSKVSVQTHSGGWESSGMPAGVGVVVYAESPGTAQAELDGLLDSLRQRFERLAVAECGVEDLQAEEALAILADLECPTCDAPVTGPRPWYCADCRTAICLTCRETSNVDPCEHLLPTEGRDGWDRKTCVACGDRLKHWKCTRCLGVHCPFCGVRSWAWRGSSWALGEERCPHLIASWDASAGEWWDVSSVGLDQLEEIAIDGHDDAAVRAAFGKLTDLAETIEESQQAGVVASLLDALIRAAGLMSVMDVSWDNANGMCSDTGADYFAADPDGARAALGDLVDRLVAGQERLDASLEDEADDRA